MLELAQEPLHTLAVGGGGGGGEGGPGSLTGTVRTGIVRTDLPLTVLPLTGLSPLQSCLSEEPVPPPLPSRTTGDAAGLPAAPLRPLTGGAEPWEDVSQVITVIISLHIITPPLL